MINDEYKGPVWWGDSKAGVWHDAFGNLHQDATTSQCTESPVPFVPKLPTELPES